MMLFYFFVKRHSLIRVCCTLGFVVFAFIASAQSLPLGLPLVDEHLRHLQVTGKSGDMRSLMIRPLVAPNAAAFDSLLFPDATAQPAAARRALSWRNGGITIMPTVLRQQYNSHHGYGWNDGAMISAKGYQLYASTGVHLRKGILSVQLQPELVTAANPAFPLLPQSYSDSVWYHYSVVQNRADAPVRMGEGPYRRIHPGQSSLRLNFRKLSLGVATENIWWGSGVRNSLMMTNNAPGFPYITFNSTAPVPTPLGNIEWQVISGLLKGSGVLPQDTARRINDSVLYTPKSIDRRYLNAFMLTWQPRWVQGLYLGLSRAFYQYESEIPNTVNGYFPVLGAWIGNSAVIENESGGRDQLLAFSFRLVLPESKAEVYGEYGRNDRSLNMRDILLEPEHSRAYVLGLRKHFVSGRGGDKSLFFEMTQLQQSPSVRLREQDSWYMHYQVRHGYTQLGQVLGAGIGTGGSNMQSLGLNWHKGVRRTSLSVDRIVRSNDFFYNAFSGERNFMRHWVDLALNFDKVWTYKRLLLSLEANFVRSLNYQWRQSDTPEGNKDVTNLRLNMGIAYRW